LTELGDDTTEAAQKAATPNTWVNTLIGQKETLKTSKTALAAAAAEDLETAKRW